MSGDGYIAPEYQQNSIVAKFRAVPRFGHSNDISKLFAPNTNSDQVDYILGTIFIGTFLMTIYILWITTLSIFTCVGKNKVGFLSGYAMVQTRTIGNGEPIKQNKCCTRVNNVRFAFLLCCFGIIGLTAVSTFYIGYNDLKIALDDIGLNALELRNLAHQGQGQANSLKTYGQYSKNIRDIFLPSIQYPKFCVNSALDDLTGLPFNATRQKVVDDLEALGNFNIDSFQDISEGLFDSVKSMSEDIRNYISLYGIQRWQLLTNFVVFCSIATLMMMTLLFSWGGNPSSFLICVSTWFLLPFFIVFVAITWLLTATFGTFAVMNADYCTGGPMLEGPDLTTRYIIERSNISEASTLLYSASLYWFNGCNSNYPFGDVNDYQTLIQSSIVSMESLKNMIENVTIPELERICGAIGAFDSFYLYLDRLNDNFVGMISSLSTITDILSCETMNGIYTDAVHEAACTDIPSSMLWSFISLLIVSVLGMIMITLRSSWLQVKEKKIKMVDEMPIISIEKLQDVEDESFNDSPSPKSHNVFRDIGIKRQDSASETTDVNVSSRITISTEKNNKSEDIIDDQAVMYQNISVADDNLNEVPSSPKDPPGYRVY